MDRRAIHISIGLIVCTLIASVTWAWVRLHRSTSIDVRGSAKRRSASDMVEWAAVVSAKENTRVSAYATLTKDVERTRQFLEGHGVAGEQIRVSAADVQELSHEENVQDGTKVISKPVFDGWRAQQRIEVTSTDVPRIERISREATQLLEKGIVIVSELPRYHYTKVAELKIEMLVEGLPLYEWARRHNPSCREVLRVLAQVAGAVAATHAVAGVHRDIKGDNVLVNPQGMRAVLMDFGAGTYAGAAPLTREALPPGTDDYRSPEAWEYAFQRPRDAATSYAAQSEDDVFSLGVCGYRLVTGWYLPPLEVKPGEPGPWCLEWPAPQPPVEANPRVDPQLSTLLMRMVTRRPEERPTAREVAESLEQMARSAGTETDRPLFQSMEEQAPVKLSAPKQPLGQGLEKRG